MVVPYSTCELDVWSVVQVMIADVLVIPLAVTLVIRGRVGAEPPPVQVRRVIEYGGNESAAAGLKLALVLVTGETTSAVSFVSVRLGDVSSVTCTVPDGALVPLKVTGSAAVRCRLKTTSE